MQDTKAAREDNYKHSQKRTLKLPQEVARPMGSVCVK